MKRLTGDGIELAVLDEGQRPAGQVRATKARS
jgi:hypothetical protein